MCQSVRLKHVLYNVSNRWIIHDIIFSSFYSFRYSYSFDNHDIYSILLLLLISWSLRYMCSPVLVTSNYRHTLLSNVANYSNDDDMVILIEINMLQSLLMLFFNRSLFSSLWVGLLPCLFSFFFMLFLLISFVGVFFPSIPMTSFLYFFLNLDSPTGIFHRQLICAKWTMIRSSFWKRSSQR